jgi:hypothetical protein
MFVKKFLVQVQNISELLKKHWMGDSWSPTTVTALQHAYLLLHITCAIFILPTPCLLGENDINILAYLKNMCLVASNECFLFRKLNIVLLLSSFPYLFQNTGAQHS